MRLRNCLFGGLVVVCVLVAGKLLISPAPAMVPLEPKMGIPVPWVKILDQRSATEFYFVVRYKPIVFTFYEGENIMHDVGYRGQRGTYDSQIWVFVPEPYDVPTANPLFAAGFTPNLFIGMAVEDVITALKARLKFSPIGGLAIEEIVAANPQLSFTAGGFRYGKLVDGEFVEAQTYVLPAASGYCNPGEPDPLAWVIEAWCRGTGDARSLAIPDAGEAHIYFK